MTKLFCAGSFDFDYLEPNYKERAEKDYRAILLGCADRLLQKRDYVQLNAHMRYIGPFYFEADGMTDESIVAEEIKMLRECTHAVFFLDSGLCPGTIAELMLASSLGKQTAIFYIRKSDQEETESKLHSPCWFAMLMSRQINANTRITACKNYPDAAEKIKRFADDLR